MKKLKLLLLIAVLTLLSFVTLGSSAGTIWATGRVSTSVTEQRYNMILYYQFNFTLMDANTTLIFGSDVIAIVPESLSVAPQRDAIYNFSGHIVETQVDDIPEGYFVVEQINTEVQVDWVDAIFQFISICASIVGLIANAISVFFFTYTGFQIPPLLVTIIIILLALYSVIKHWKAIGIILGIICIVLVVSGVFNILRLAWLSV